MTKEFYILIQLLASLIKSNTRQLQFHYYTETQERGNRKLYSRNEVCRFKAVALHMQNLPIFQTIGL